MTPDALPLSVLLAGLLTCLLFAACGGGSGEGPATPGQPAGADLSSFSTARLDLDGVPYEAWIADSPQEQERGLMFVRAEQLAPIPDGTPLGTPRGMLFPFAGDGIVGFVMTNTYVPLDVAFLGADGTILEIRQLVPLDPTPVVPLQPIRYALEVLQGDFAMRGLGVGSVLQLPIGAP
jgi:uncharacterized membrane protein (UPF0127 family)